MHVSVIKVGGSLFDLPDLSTRLLRLLDQLGESRPLLICGGGRAADLVREWDRLHQLEASQAHWLAIHSLSLNEQLLCTSLPKTRRVSSKREALQAWDNGLIPVLNSYNYLTRTSSRLVKSLPETWDVTSDSIAAWVTLTWPSEELILVKSVNLPEEELNASDLADAGLVDAYFPKLAESVPCLRWCCLRDDEDSYQLAAVTSGKNFQSKNATGPA